MIFLLIAWIYSRGYTIYPDRMARLKFAIAAELLLELALAASALVIGMGLN